MQFIVLRRFTSSRLPFGGDSLTGSNLVFEAILAILNSTGCETHRIAIHDCSIESLSTITLSDSLIINLKAKKIETVQNTQCESRSEWIVQPQHKSMLQLLGMKWSQLDDRNPTPYRRS